MPRLKGITVDTLEVMGFYTLTNYFEYLAETYGIEIDILYSLLDTYGEDELFREIVNICEDGEYIEKSA